MQNNTVIIKINIMLFIASKFLKRYYFWMLKQCS